jgi:putative transposase
MAVLAGTDFFTAEVLTWRGLVTYYVLFFLHLEMRRITLAGITRHPTETWMAQMSRNADDEPAGAVRQCPYPLHDGDANYCVVFQDVFASEGIRLPQASTSQSQSKRVSGTLDSICPGGMSVPANPVW